MRKLAFAAAVLTAALASPSQAAITIYTSQAAFLAAVTTPGVDTFETLSITGSTPSPITRTAGTYGYTASASTSSFFGAGTNADHWLSTNLATDSITFSSFTGGVRALGGLFFGSDISGLFAAGSVTLTATDASGSVTQTITNATTSSFLGFVSTGPLTSVTISAVQPATPLWPTVNNLTLAGAATPTPGVPEPATWAMMIVGFGLVGAAMRRRATMARVTYA